MNKTKIINIINNIFNSILFLLVVKMFCWYFYNEAYVIPEFLFDKFFNNKFLMVFFLIMTLLYFKINFLYAISKKYNFINLLEKHNFFVKFLLVFLVDLIVLYEPSYITVPEGLLTTKDICIFGILIGAGYMNSFFCFTFAKFLARKFPKKFSWLRYLYFLRLEKLPNLAFDILLFLINLYFCIYLIYNPFKHQLMRLFGEYFYIVPAVIAFIFAIKIIYDIVLRIKRK